MKHPRVAYSLAEVQEWAPRASAVTLGVFDGVHLGHKRIIEELVRAKQAGGIEGCYLLTFHPHPLVVTHSKMTPPMLTSMSERLELLGRFEIDGVFVLGFDEEMANLDYRSFLDKYLLRAFDMKRLVLGYDCHFGKNREGSPEKVKEEAERKRFDLTVVPAVTNGEVVISSTKIRNLVIEGELESANTLLGHPYVISGRVAEGHGKGRVLGFPTANISISDPHKLWPPEGVYAVTVAHGGRIRPGMMNVGRAPTMKVLDEGTREIEVHILDFSGDLYGENLVVYCHHFMRRERTFPSPEALKHQLEEDKKRASQLLGRVPGDGL